MALRFLERSAPGKRLSAEVLNRLRAHPWPGNVRELEQVLARAAAFSDGVEIGPDNLDLENTRMTVVGVSDLENAQRDFTQSFVREALDRVGGNRATAARELGVSERTLYRVLTGMAGGPDKSVSE